MKKNNKLALILATVILSGTSIAHATGAGFYMGGQIGRSNLNNTNRDIATSTTPPIVNASPGNTGIGQRIFMGYYMSSYFGYEGGFTHYAPSIYNPSVSANNGSPNIRENGFDFVVKGMYPIKDSGVDVFAKGGVAMIKTSLAGSIAEGEGTTSGSNLYIRPTATVGVGYDFTPNWVFDLSYSRVFKGGAFQNADFISFGISYHFVDTYCGQFLC